jgi:sulfur carrier protein ThiS
MNVTLSYTGYLKFDGAKSGSTIEVEDGSSVADLLAGFHIPHEQHRFLTIFVNDEKADSRRMLQDGDQLMVIIQIGGG